MPTALDLQAAAPADAVALVVTASAGADVAVLDPRAAVQLRASGMPAATVGAAIEALVASIARDKVKGGPGDVVAVPVGDRLLIAAGVGAGSPRDFRRAGAAIARRIRSVERAAVVLPANVAAAQLRAVAEGLLLGGYSYKITNNPKPPTLKSVAIVARGASSESALRSGVTTANATMLARDLAFTPSSTKTPQWLAQQARAVARKAGLEVVVRDERQLAAEGFGGVVAVGMGSAHPPRLIELTYTPDDPVPGHVVLVGKGITFDSGGLSLKPTAGMVAMKTDMAAGGAVIADHVGAARPRRPGEGHRPGAGGREHAVGFGATAERRDHALRRHHGRGAQHRRGGPARCSPTPWPTPTPRSTLTW